MGVAWTTCSIKKDEVFAIMGAAFEVYNTMGHGFAEPVYHELLEIEFGLRNIPFEAQKDILITYKGKQIRHTYRADFVAFGKIIIEIKALDKLAGREEAQLLNYLKATRLHLGLPLNFGSFHKLEWKRFALTK